MSVKRRSRQEWAEIVGQWERSGMSLKAFAKKNRMKRSTLSWWAWEIRRKASGQERPLFMPVQVRPDRPDKEAEVDEAAALRNPVATVRLGPVALRLHAEADPQWVARVMVELSQC